MPFHRTVIWAECCMYVYVCVCLLVCYKKGSVSFDLNYATFTQKVDDRTSRLINFIRLKTVQNWLKNP